MRSGVGISGYHLFVMSLWFCSFLVIFAHLNFPPLYKPSLLLPDTRRLEAQSKGGKK